MSFAFLPLFTGDYLRDTRTLSPLRHGVYLLLLVYCWDTKGPVPLEEQDAAAITNCRSGEEIDALRYVLSKYFTRCEDGYYNERMQEEIADSEFISKKRSEAGKKGAEARKKHISVKHLRQVLNTSQANAKHLPVTPTLTLTHTPTLTPTKGKSKGAATFELPPWVPASSWADFEEMRRKIRKPLTDAARTVNLRKLDQLRSKGFDPKLVLEEAVANSWTGIWEPRKATAEGSRHSATGQHMANVARDWLREKAK